MYSFKAFTEMQGLKTTFGLILAACACMGDAGTLNAATLNVTSFGATPNDAIDDGTAINNAINASAAGDTVTFPPGVYNISSVLTLKSDRTYKGGGTIRQLGVNRFALQTQWDAGRNILLENLTLDGGGISYAGSGNVGATNIDIQGCTFKNNTHPDYPYYNSIYIPIGARYCEFTGNSFTNVPGGFSTWNLYTCQISDNWFHSVGQGISIESDGWDVAVVRNTGVRLHRMGIEFQCIGGTAKNSVVEDNHFSNWNTPYCDSFGLSIVPPLGPNVAVRYNTCLARPPVPGTWENRFGYGIEIANEIFCRDNFVEGHWWNGIVIGGGNSIVSNNVCRGPHDGQFKTPATIVFESGGNPATVIITNNFLKVTSSYIEHPDRLSATVSTGRVDLAWADNSDNETGFKVERRVPGGSYSLLATVGASVTSYSDTNIAPSTQYVYRIQAFNNSGDQTYSPALLVAIPAFGSSSGQLGGSVSSADPAYNLTILGTIDWAHWGRGGVYNRFDHKAGGGGQISNVSPIGSGHSGFHGNGIPRAATWTDGTPTASASSEAGYYFTEALNAGWSFTVPADAMARTLYVWLGGWGTVGRFTAHLSDASAPDYVQSITGTANYQKVVRITYQAPSAGQTLTVSFVKTAHDVGGAGSVDLKAAWLVAGSAPTVALNEPLDGLSLRHPASVTMTATAADSDGTISKVEFFAGTNLLGADTTSPYAYTWSNVPAGSYLLKAVATDNSGMIGSSAPSTLFVLGGTGGRLAGFASPASSSYDLTALGTNDWAHWGRGGVYGRFDHKTSGGSQISNVTPIGSGHTAFNGVGIPRAADWTDGTPTSSASSEAGYYYTETLGSGWTFTVPADTQSRAVSVWLGGWGTVGTLTAHLSDKSAADYVQTVTGTANYQHVVRLTYQAASAGQNLRISVVKTVHDSGGAGSVDLKAAWLTDASRVTNDIVINNIAPRESNVNLSFQTPVPNRTHIILQTSNLVAPQWSTVTNAMFTNTSGGVTQATFAKPPESPRFYRVAVKPATGPLRVSTANPRYFADGSGEIVYLTGAHTWNSLQEMGLADPPSTFDFEAYLDFLDQHNHNFIRLWRWEHPKSTEIMTQRLLYSAPNPWKRVGPGVALDGKLKFDLIQFDDGYFSRLRSRVQAACDRGIYVSIMLFEGWVMKSTPDGWASHPFHSANNVNGVDGDANHNGNGVEIFSLASPAVTQLQEAYVRKVIDTVNDLDNVLYEITNENDWDSWSWQTNLVSFIRQYELTKSKQHPVGLTSLGYGGSDDTDRLFASSADWIAPNPNKYDFKDNPPTALGNKVVLPDTDHLWGLGGDRVWVWKCFTRGHNPIFMDPYKEQVLSAGSQEAQYEALRRALGDTRYFATRMNLAAATPRPDLASTGYCLAQPGVEFLVYQPLASQSFTVQLPTGSWQYEWFNPATGIAASRGNIQAAGGAQPFTAPFAGDAVLYLKQL